MKKRDVRKGNDMEKAKKGRNKYVTGNPEIRKKQWRMNRREGGIDERSVGKR